MARVSFILAFLFLARAAHGADPCPASTTRIEGTLIAWVADVRETSLLGAEGESATTRVEPFRPLAILKNGSLTETSGASIAKDQKFWRALAPDQKPLHLASVSSLLDHMNVDHCVYFGGLSDPKIARWTLLTSEPLTGAFRAPTKADHARFAKERTECVVQGDYAPDETPSCTKPELLAVTDIDKNGKLEYWATDPYRWDTGLSVFEDSGTLTPILQVCVGCSD